MGFDFRLWLVIYEVVLYTNIPCTSDNVTAVKLSKEIVVKLCPDLFVVGMWILGIRIRWSWYRNFICLSERYERSRLGTTKWYLGFGSHAGHRSNHAHMGEVWPKPGSRGTKLSP